MIRRRVSELLRDQRGFTLIEMVTVLMVIGVLSALILVNTQTGDRRQQLRDDASDFIASVRNAEARASAGQPVGGTSRKAYGICVTSTSASDASGSFPNSKCAPPGGNPSDAYQVYARTQADTDARPALDQAPDKPDILVSRTLSKDVSILPKQLYLDFMPPQPLMSVNGNTNNRSLFFFSPQYGFKIVQLRPSSGAAYVQ
jgi:prepilin-type N-terminal cleavage/methylation domain-containing protein